MRDDDQIRGALVFGGGLRPHPFTTCRHLKDGTEREVDHVEVDGARYERVRECTLTRTYSGEPCSDWTCSECGKTHCWHNAARVGERCPRCGAVITRVEMEP